MCDEYRARNPNADHFQLSLGIVLQLISLGPETRIILLSWCRIDLEAGRSPFLHRHQTGKFEVNLVIYRNICIYRLTGSSQACNLIPSVEHVGIFM